MLKKLVTALFLFALCFALTLFMLSRMAEEPAKRATFDIIAHRGVHQDYAKKDKGIGLPTRYTKFIWGWPNRFLDKVYDADMRFYLYLNTIEEADRYSQVPLNGIVTDHIEVLGQYYTQFSQKPRVSDKARP